MTTFIPEAPLVEPELPGLTPDHFRDNSLPLVREQIAGALLALDQASEDKRDEFLPPVFEALQRYDVLASLTGVGLEDESTVITHAREATGHIKSSEITTVDSLQWLLEQGLSLGDAAELIEQE